MPKYLFHGSYTPEGFQGLLKEGGSKRREAAEQALKSVDGKLDAFYFAFGDNDETIHDGKFSAMETHYKIAHKQTCAVGD